MFKSQESMWARLKPRLTCRPRFGSRWSSVICRHLESSMVKWNKCCPATSATEPGRGRQRKWIRPCWRPSGQRAPLRNCGWERLARSFWDEPRSSLQLRLHLHPNRQRFSAWSEQTWDHRTPEWRLFHFCPHLGKEGMPTVEVPIQDISLDRQVYPRASCILKSLCPRQEEEPVVPRRRGQSTFALRASKP